MFSKDYQATVCFNAESEKEAKAIIEALRSFLRPKRVWYMCPLTDRLLETTVWVTLKETNQVKKTWLDKIKDWLNFDSFPYKLA